MPIDNHGPEGNFTATCRQIILDEYDRFSISQCINESGEILLRSIHIPYPLQNLPVRYDPNSSEHQSKIEKFELFKEKFLAQDPALYNEEPEIICGEGTVLIDHICQVTLVDELHIPRIEKTVEIPEEKTVDIPEEKPSKKSVNWFSSIFDWFGGLFK